MKCICIKRKQLPSCNNITHQDSDESGNLPQIALLFTKGKSSIMDLLILDTGPQHGAGISAIPSSDLPYYSTPVRQMALHCRVVILTILMNVLTSGAAICAARLTPTPQRRHRKWNSSAASLAWCCHLVPKMRSMSSSPSGNVLPALRRGELPISQ